MHRMAEIIPDTTKEMASFLCVSEQLLHVLKTSKVLPADGRKRPDPTIINSFRSEGVEYVEVFLAK